jgi:hypothetical protein
MSINQNYMQELGDWVNDFASEPGIDRDNPRGSKKAYIDGQWMRFDNGHARKMGGYESIVLGTGDIIRALYTVSLQDFTRLFIFRDTGVFQVDIMQNGTVTGEVNRTPISWLAPAPGSPSLVFSIDQMTLYDDETDTSTSFIFFVAPPNSEVINQQTEAPIYWGPLNDITPFVDLGQSTSGGIIVDEPRLVKYGNNGVLYWSGTVGSTNIPDPTSWPPENRVAITSDKILAAKPFPGGLIMWTSNMLERVVFDQQTLTYRAVAAATQISLMSPSSIVAGHNSSYYWVGENQMYVYQGAVNIIDNGMNRNQFFKNINPAYPGKVFGIYVGNFDEIWWFQPDLNHTECNRLYNFQYKKNIWTDSECSRTAADTQNKLRKPVLADGEFNKYLGVNVYSIWKHEVGYDIVVEGESFPIESWIQTKLFSVFQGNPQINTELRVSKVEKDVTQIGDVDVQVLTYAYANSMPYSTAEFTFTPTTTQQDIQISGRYVSFKYTSNTIGGFMQIGLNNVDYKLGAVSPGGN